MTIKFPDLLASGMWDWACLEGWNDDKRIYPSDIDGCLERRGNMLWIETMRTDAFLHGGQRRTYNSLALRGDYVVFLWGKPGEPVNAELWHKNKRLKSNHYTLPKFKRFLRCWWEWASENPVKFPDWEEDEHDDA